MGIPSGLGQARLPGWRGPRCVTGQVRDERYHVPVTVDWAGHRWRIDLTLWLHDPHANVTN